MPELQIDVHFLSVKTLKRGVWPVAPSRQSYSMWRRMDATAHTLGWTVIPRTINSELMYFFVGEQEADNGCNGAGMGRGGYGWVGLVDNK